MSKHTLGPWVVGTKTEFGTHNANMIFDSQDGSVAMVYGLPSNTMLEKMDEERYAEGKARARLIAAAPDLLEALKDLEAGYERLKGQGYPVSDCQKQARAAIAKATGEA